MFKSFLITLAKEFVFEGMVAVLRDQAKKTPGGMDDAAIDLLVSQKDAILTQLSKAF